MTHRIYLIPGFFGFANLGGIEYFTIVRARLERAFAEYGEQVQIHPVLTLPTASLPKRAARLLDAVATTAGDSKDPIHLIGHSTGGLDARLLTSPGVRLPTETPPAALVDRVRTVVAIASPHFGTPQAALFTSMYGQRLLRALSMATLHGIRLGGIPLPALLALAGTLPRIGRMQGPLLGILDQVYSHLLKDFDAERQTQIEAFFSETSLDQALLLQLSPAAMGLFNAAVSNRPQVRYGSVVAQGRAPSWRKTIDIGLSPAGQAMYGIYRALYELADSMPEEALDKISPKQEKALIKVYGELPSAKCNDAIVPTLSQVHGEIIHAAWADHLDLIGHYHGPTAKPPNVDWLTTKSGFDHKCFHRLWDDVVGFILR